MPTKDIEPAEFDSKTFIASAPTQPGVYRMYDKAGETIYVGKAKNLKNRLSSYFSSAPKPIKTATLVDAIRHIEVTVTTTEGEALILEDTLIKRHRPKYNILLRDDKSYPFVRASLSHDYPRLSVYRGRRNEAAGEFFGPYPNAYAVRETINNLQKIFKIRSCEDSYFKHRTRPCLQYQIHRCSAPCVDYISKGEYFEDVKKAVLFLSGKGQLLVDDLVAEMDEASAKLDYEKAAKIRDQITLMRELKEQQVVSGVNNDADVIGYAQEGELSGFSILFIREGRVIGSRAYFPKGSSISNELNEFVTRYYLSNAIPKEIILPVAIEDQAIIEKVLSEKTGTKISVKNNVRDLRRKWVAMANVNAKQAVLSKLGSNQYYEKGFRSVNKWLNSDHIRLIECFDISHSSGEKAVASCTCFDASGAVKERYRKFNLTGITPGDDYAAMFQAVQRHFKRLVNDKEKPMPDILLIDGGPNQVAKAVEALASLSLGFEDVIVIGIAKGPERKLGEEDLYINDSKVASKLPRHDYGLRLLQAVRDEAHRFAVTGHRKRRDKARVRSSLEDIPGLGPKRRQLLLKNFGGLQGLEQATLAQIQSVPQISGAIASAVFQFFHPNE